MQPYNQEPDNITIKKFIITETRNNYQDVYRRNFSINLNHRDLEKLEEMVHPTSSLKNYTISESEVVKELPEVINMTSGVSGMAKIDNGWQTTRGRFIMEVEMSFNGTVMIYYIQGYTNYLELSHTGILDPEIIYYINSITHFHKTYHPITKQLGCKMLGTFDIIRKNGETYYEYTNADTEYLVRPVDIITQLYSDDELQMANTTVNTMSILNKDVVSNKHNNNPLKYFTNTINAFTGARMEMQDTIIPGDILKNASTQVREPMMLENGFINKLYNITGDTFPTSFKIRDLEQMDSTIGSRINVITRDGYALPEQFNTMLDTDVTESTINPTFENKQASLISNMLPSIMADCTLGKIDMSLTNKNMTDEVIIADAKSLVDEFDPVIVLNKFKHLVNVTLFPLLSLQGQMMFDCFISCTLVGDLTIGIQYYTSYNNNGPIIYRFPLYAGGLFSPVIGNEIAKQTLTNDFGTIFSNNFQYNQNLLSLEAQPQINNPYDPNFFKGANNDTYGILS